MTQKPTDPQSHPPSLSIDWELYGSMLEDSDLSDAQKKEFIQTLWSIVVSFVDLGFGLHPLQQVCGEDISLDELSTEDMLGLSGKPLKSEFNKTPAPRQDGQRKGSL